MSVSKKNESIPDARLEKMLLSLRDDHSVPEKPPVVNTFRLEMEAERRRNRRQVQIVAVASWFSVTATLSLLAYAAFVLLPETEKYISPETRLLLAQLKQSLSSYGWLFAALEVTVALGYVLSALLMIVKRKKKN